MAEYPKYLLANPDHPAFDHEGRTMDIAVETNVDWSVSSNTTWCKGEKTSGSVLKVTVDPNNSTEERESILTLKEVNGSLSCTVTVKQTGVGTVITVSPTAIELSPDGGSQDITVTSNGEWKATSSATWCTIDKTGKQNGNATVKVTVDKIASTSPRNATISFECGTETQSVTVTQKGIELTAAPASLASMKADGESRDITVTSNTDWTVTSSEAWCIPSVNDGKGNSVVSITVGRNTTTVQRTATLTIAAKNAPTITKTVTVTQEAADIILEVSPASLNFKADGEAKSVSVNCNTGWTVASSEEAWCTVKKTSDTAADITAAKNTTSARRTATVSFKAGTKTVEVSIAQDAPGAPVATPTSLEFEAGGGSKNVSLSCGTAWAATSDQTWCTLNKTTGTGDATIVVSAATNTATTARTATITIKAENGLSTTVNITQKAADVILTVTPATQTVKAAGGNGSLTVESNTGWTATSDQAWCRIATASGTGSGTIALTIDENKTIAPRTATITVKAGTLSRTATVTQDGADIILTVTDTSFNAEGGTGTITVTSNTDWTASSDQTWCSLRTTSGTGTGTISLTVAENTSTTQRKATITVKAGSKTASATVTQSGVAYHTSATPTSLNFGQDASSQSISVNSNESWTASSDASWCTLSRSSGSNNGTVSVSVAANTTRSQRTATITVKGSSSGDTTTITVTQTVNAPGSDDNLPPTAPARRKK